MKITVEIEIGTSYVLPVDKQALRAAIVSWAKTYEMVESGFYPSVKIRMPNDD